MYISIVLLPFIAATFSGFFGRALGVKGVHIINITCLLITTLLSFIAYYEVVLCNSPVSIEFISWINIEQLKITWAFYFDELTVNMLIPVLIVSLLVHIYSVGYMGEDPHQQRFFSYISLFTGLMLILVTGNNFLVMFLGWEGVGVCSYLLVHFWYTRVGAVKSALNAMFTNRVGDYFLTIGFFAIFFTFGTLDYATVFSLAPHINTNVITFIAILLLLGAAAKSAQLGLHIWLPMAMEGPTPVSSLIHAATMVTAGVYILIRCSPLLEQSELALTIIMITGAITAFFAASVGLFQNDIKKVIAYSTMSQLGMMVIAVGLSQFNVALTHLVLHAMYKAGLFLAAGSVLHALGDQQDFRKFGGLVKILPVTYTVMLIASLSLGAFPWLSGYYSKDLIIELAYGSYSSLGYLVYLLATIAATFTMLYSVKLIYLTFLTYGNASKGNYEKAHESSFMMTFPLIILGILSVYLGNISKDYFLGLGSQGLGNSIFTHPNHIVLIDTEFGVPTLNKLLPLILSIIFAILALYIFDKKPIWLLNTSKISQDTYRFFNQRYWFELIYNKCIAKSTLYIGYVTNSILDRGALELIGPRGAVAGLYKISNYFASFDSGSIARYAFVMFSGLLFMLITWVMFATSDTMDLMNVNKNSVNFVSTVPLAITNYNYLILNIMSYLNFLNNIINYLFKDKKQNYVLSDLWNTNVLLSAETPDPEVPNKSRISSPERSTGSNLSPENNPNYNMDSGNNGSNDNLGDNINEDEVKKKENKASTTESTKDPNNKEKKGKEKENNLESENNSNIDKNTTTQKETIQNLPSKGKEPEVYPDSDSSNQEPIKKPWKGKAPMSSEDYDLWNKLEKKKQIHNWEQAIQERDEARRNNKDGDRLIEKKSEKGEKKIDYDADDESKFGVSTSKGKRISSNNNENPINKSEEDKGIPQTSDSVPSDNEPPKVHQEYSRPHIKISKKLLYKEPQISEKVRKGIKKRNMKSQEKEDIPLEEEKEPDYSPSTSKPAYFPKRSSSTAYEKEQKAYETYLSKLTAEERAYWAKWDEARMEADIAIAKQSSAREVSGGTKLTDEEKESIRDFYRQAFDVGTPPNSGDSGNSDGVLKDSVSKPNESVSISKSNKDKSNVSKNESLDYNKSQVEIEEDPNLDSFLTMKENPLISILSYLKKWLNPFLSKDPNNNNSDVSSEIVDNKLNNILENSEEDWLVYVISNYPYEINCIIKTISSHPIFCTIVWIILTVTSWSLRLWSHKKNFIEVYELLYLKKLIIIEKIQVLSIWSKAKK